VPWREPPLQLLDQCVFGGRRGAARPAVSWQRGGVPHLCAGFGCRLPRCAAVVCGSPYHQRRRAGSGMGV